MRFDIIGSKEKAVAIVEIPEGFDEKKIAENIMKKNKNVKSVLKKLSARKGELRLREYELIAGDSNTEVTHKEFGYLLKLDPKKVYFSPREATERQRIAGQVKPDETILVMFGGIGCYGVSIAKKQPDVKKIYSVEINPDAHNYAIENVRVNKISHLVIPILGDVREKCKDYFGKCDRVVMPLPLGAESFLDIAVNCLKPSGGVIHFYSWGEEERLFDNALKVISENLKRFNKKYRIINKKIVSQYSPRRWKICIDIEIG
jgi:tRNA (guanine37-N1)-methyltransferase